MKVNMPLNKETKPNQKLSTFKSLIFISIIFSSQYHSPQWHKFSPTCCHGTNRRSLNTSRALAMAGLFTVKGCHQSNIWHLSCLQILLVRRITHLWSVGYVCSSLLFWWKVSIFFNVLVYIWSKILYTQLKPHIRKYIGKLKYGIKIT